MSFTDGLLLTTASAAICITFPKILSILLNNRTNETKIALKETLPQAPAEEVPSLLTEA